MKRGYYIEDVLVREVEGVVSLERGVKFPYILRISTGSGAHGLGLGVKSHFRGVWGLAWLRMRTTIYKGPSSDL